MPSEIIPPEFFFGHAFNQDPYAQYAGACRSRRLAFGFHSNTNGVRQASVFYKSEFE
jgi:hypothetical protein